MFNIGPWLFGLMYSNINIASLLNDYSSVRLFAANFPLTKWTP